MGQFQHRPLQVKGFLLVLSHAIELLLLIGLKADRQAVVRPPHGGELPALDHHRAVVGAPHGPVPLVLLQEHLPVFIQEGGPAVLFNDGRDGPVVQAHGLVAFIGDAVGLSLDFLLGQQGPRLFQVQGPHVGSPGPQAVFPPGLNDKQVSV